MNSLRVWYYAYYLTTIEGIKWRSDDYKANRLVKCAKGEPFNGYVDFSVSRQDGTSSNVRFTDANRDQLLGALCGTVAKKLMGEIQGTFNIVPIPNKSATIADNATFRTEEMANRVASFMNGRTTVTPILRWSQPLQKAHNGGPRSAFVLTPYLQQCGTISGPTIIFDDVITSGGHMIACNRKLREVGIEPMLGVAVGRTTDTQQPHMTGWHEEQLGDDTALFDIDL